MQDECSVCRRTSDATNKLHKVASVFPFHDDTVTFFLFEKSIIAKPADELHSAMHFDVAIILKKVQGTTIAGKTLGGAAVLEKKLHIHRERCLSVVPCILNILSASRRR